MNPLNLNKDIKMMTKTKTLNRQILSQEKSNFYKPKIRTVSAYTSGNIFKRIRTKPLQNHKKTPVYFDNKQEIS